MQNRESLAHALSGEAKRKYNKSYYEQNADYWVEYRNKHNNALSTGSTGTMSGIAGISPDEKTSAALARIKGTKTKAEKMADEFYEYITGESVERVSPKITKKSTVTDVRTQLTNTGNNTFYNNYYKPENVSKRAVKTAVNTRGSSIYSPGYSSAYRNAVQTRVDMAKTKREEEQAKRIRIRNRIASVYKLEWAEAQERAKRLPNRIISSVKTAISNAKKSLVEAIRLGKK